MQSNRIAHSRQAKPAAPRRVPRAVVVLTLIAALVAAMPIVAAIVRPGANPAVARTAFASAPAGEYVVVAKAGEESDAILVAPAADPGAAMEIATVQHLRGYAAIGSVSPEGRRLALVVADSGTPARPVASLYILNLETTALARMAGAVDYLQAPVWAPDGQSLYFTRTGESGGPLTNVAFFRVWADGRGEEQVLEFESVLGAYGTGFDVDGRFVSVVIDSRGSTAYRDGTEAVRLSSQITRDWELSPDGAWLAFIEADTSTGLSYRAKVVSLDGAPAGEAVAQSAGAATQQLGVSWKPGAAAPTFGQEPAASSEGSAVAQAGVSGFDVPLAYSTAGDYLAVQHWSGAGFEQPGQVSLDLLSDGGVRTPLAAFSRFFGWAAR